jgi:hypothetical protein
LANRAAIEFPRFDFSNPSYLATQAAEMRDFFHPLHVAFEGLQKSLQRLQNLSPRTQEAVLLLGFHGWYLDLEMTLPQLWTLEKALSDGNTAKAEETLAEYFEGRSDDIENSIIKRFPRREHLLRPAFGAHRRQEYVLSIPVFLTQTDGICKDATNHYFFLKRYNKPQTAHYVEQIAADALTASLLSPLARTLPISASERERSSGDNALNRHAVLHGEALNYGTKINSLKAISLINYVAHILEREITVNN